MTELARQIANELNVQSTQTSAAIRLLDEGATVPFIARYRKEATGALDDTQLRQLQQRLNYLRELAERQQSILASIDAQGKLNGPLKQQILAAETKTRLEDLYLPYKNKRRTKGQIAMEAGLGELAQTLLSHPHKDPMREASQFTNPTKEVADPQAALDGAQAILTEQFSEHADLLSQIRSHLWANATLEAKASRSKKAADNQQLQEKFRDYIGHSEALKKLPPHRILALLRGKTEGVLQLSLNADPGQQGNYCEVLIARQFGIKNRQRAADQWLLSVVQHCWKTKIGPAMESGFLSQLRDTAQADAIKVFSDNLKDLLMTAPAGARATMGLDPGIRTGVKVAIVDNTGKLLDTDTIYPHAPRHQWDQSIHTLGKLVAKYQVDLISIGNGTGSRETDKLVAQLQQQQPELTLTRVMVNEAGASVYSASESAAKEFPQLDVSLRGAVSIARRLQDPLAELVKIEAKAIGVGQYQHDVNQSQLALSLNQVVEDCVNAVGVDLNMASVPLLSLVSGLNPTLAHNIVNYRDQHGRFGQRRELLKVARLGPKAFEQAAGFLRISDGSNPLDASAVHPEAYPLVERLLTQHHKSMSQVIGNRDFLTQLDPRQLTDEHFGLPTVTDIISELEKPGRDPRPEFKTASFKEGVEKPQDLRAGMRLEGVVTNVTNFGAFVDIGVHQDGLVHISALADKFVSDPRDVVKTGELVTVRVIEVDLQRKRISLSMRSEDKTAVNREAKTSTTTTRQPRNQKRASSSQTPSKQHSRSPVSSNTAFADAFAKAKKQ